MLVLSRRETQEVLFPHLDIKVKILQVHGRVVKLGIDAPKFIKVLRSEASDRGSQVADASQDHGLTRERDCDHQRRNALQLLQKSLR